PLVDQTAGAHKKTLAKPRQDRHLPCHRRRNYFCHFLPHQNKATALHAAGISVTLASSRAPLDRSSPISETMRNRHRLDLSRHRACHHAAGRASFPRGSAFSTNTRPAATGNGIWRSRFSGTEPGLVFSIAGAWVDDSAQRDDSGNIHGKKRAALRGFTDLARRQDISGSARDLEELFDTRLQHRQRQASRSYACVEAGLMKRWLK